MGYQGANMEKIERESKYKITVHKKQRGAPRSEFVDIRGLPDSVQHWAQKLQEDYGVSGDKRWKQSRWQNWQQSHQWYDRSDSKGGQGYSKGRW